MTCKAGGYVFVVSDNSSVFYSANSSVGKVENVAVIAAFHPRHTASRGYPISAPATSRDGVVVLRLDYGSGRICSRDYLW